MLYSWRSISLSFRDLGVKSAKAFIRHIGFKDRSVRSGSLSLLVQFTVAFGFFFVAVQFIAYVLGYGPLDTGLSFLPTAIGLFPASLIAIPLTKKLVLELPVFWAFAYSEYPSM